LRRVAQILFLVFHLSFSAQNSTQDIRIANNYFISGEYDKAVMYFDKISQDETAINEIYNYYRLCLLELKRFKDAEKLCKAVIKTNPENLAYNVDLGLVYQQAEKPEKKEQQFSKAIGSIQSKTNYSQISALGFAFEKIGELNYAISVYITGNKFNQTNPYAYHQKLAYIYNKQGETQKMIDIFLELIKQSEGFLSVVQSGLSNGIDFTTDLKAKELLRKALLKQAQLNPRKIIYTELLAWFYTLESNYESALVQVRSLDKKLDKNGSRIMSLGVTALNNDKYDIAIKCYDEVISSSSNKELVYKAENNRLLTFKKKIINGIEIDKDELLALKNNYLKLLNQYNSSGNLYSINKRKFEVLKQLADLEAHHLKEYSLANKHIKEAINLSGINDSKKGELRLELADILVLQNNIWEASLLYLKIEKQFSNDPIGHEAKFRNAKIYYFTGEFDWCQAQLDVLKASTSKLIANDALELSLLITDNYNMDTTVSTMQIFAKADMFKSQYQFDDALTYYDSIIDNYKNHSLNDDVLFRKAEINISKHQYNNAIQNLELLLEEYPTSLLIDNSLFMLGDIYEHKIKDLVKAKEYYKSLLFNHSGSLFVVEARKRFRKLAGSTNETINKNS
jgi:tetratricopeptide (TPR) repeat protein